MNNTLHLIEPLPAFCRRVAERVEDDKVTLAAQMDKAPSAKVYDGKAPGPLAQAASDNFRIAGWRELMGFEDGDYFCIAQEADSGTRGDLRGVQIGDRLHLRPAADYESGEV